MPSDGAASGSRDGGSGEATGKKEPIKPSPVKTIGALVAFFGLNALMQPTSYVRWYLADLIGTGHPTKIPRVIILEGRQGTNAFVVSGEYVLLEHRVHGRPAWFKDNPEQPAYVIWDKCGAWLITQYPDGRAPKCDGWTFAFCPKMPWDCRGTWQTREDNNWIADPTLKVTAAWDGSPVPQDQCTAEDEESLLSSVADIDVVIPWVNGSDPAWLDRRAEACNAWQWALWPDAVMRSGVTQSCLREEDALKEARDFVVQGKCGKGAHGKEGACWKQPNLQNHTAVQIEGKARDAHASGLKLGLTTQNSICFKRFVDNHCTGRLKTIGDHDELRYLIRSLEAHMDWHKGRVLLIAPRGQVPNWLRPKGRLQIIHQEDLLQAVVSSPWYTKGSGRGRTTGFAPDRIFNDYPIEAALPFITDVHRVVMLLQDDILLAHPVTPCQFFTLNPTGLRLYARPFQAEKLKDPYDAVYASMQRRTVHAWRRISDQGDSASKGKNKHSLKYPYYQDMHLPNMLQTHVFMDLWRDHGDVMSSIVDAAFRHPNLSSAIALHHSQVIRLSQQQDDQSTSPEDDERVEFISNSKVINLAAHSGTSLPLEQRQWLELVISSAKDWRDKTQHLPPEASSLPTFISFQDGLGDGAESQAAELDCLKEKWLNKLLPAHSSFEDPEFPPSRCSTLQAAKGRSKKKGNRSSKQAAEL